jgi:transcriptional regulator with XRE-family HTH domain
MTATTGANSLLSKIARLVEERGWNQEDFARITKLNRQTIRQILLGQGRKPHNATVQACAKALGLSVSELRTLPLEQLLPRMHGVTTRDDGALQRLLDSAQNADLLAWLERNADRARQLSSSEVEELLGLQEQGAALNAIGVERFVELLERKRELIDRIRILAGTEYLELLEKFVELLYDKVNPPSSADVFAVGGRLR